MGWGRGHDRVATAVTSKGTRGGRREPFPSATTKLKPIDKDRQIIHRPQVNDTCGKATNGCWSSQCYPSSSVGCLPRLSRIMLNYESLTILRTAILEYLHTMGIGTNDALN